MQRRRGLVAFVGLILFGLLMVGPLVSGSVGTWLGGWSGVSGIESQLKSEAEQVLIREGVADHVVEVDGRNLTVLSGSNVAPATRNSLAAIAGVGSIDYAGLEGSDIDVGQGESDGSDGSDLAETSANTNMVVDENEIAAMIDGPGGRAVVVFSGDQVALSGRVETEEGADSLRRATQRVARAIGAGGVSDQIEVANGPGNDQTAVSSVAAIVRQMGDWLSQAELVLDSGNLALRGQPKSAEAGEKARRVVEQVTSRVSLNGSVELAPLGPESLALLDGATGGAGATDNDGAEGSDNAGVAETDSGSQDAAAFQPGGEPVVSTIQFEPGSAQLTPEGEQLTDAFADRLVGMGATVVAVRAHTGGEGDPDVNFFLSQQRADAVLERLINAGVPSGTAVGLGDSEPIADISTSEGRAANERVDLAVVEGN